MIIATTFEVFDSSGALDRLQVDLGLAHPEADFIVHNHPDRFGYLGGITEGIVMHTDRTIDSLGENVARSTAVMVRARPDQLQVLRDMNTGEPLGQIGASADVIQLARGQDVKVS